MLIDISLPFCDLKIIYSISDPSSERKILPKFSSYIEHPELLYGVSFLGVRSDHALANYGTTCSQTLSLQQIEKSSESKEITFSISNSKIANPLNQKAIPVIICDHLPYKTPTTELYVGYGSALDHEIASVADFPRFTVFNEENDMSEEWNDCSRLVNSGPYTGMTVGEARKAVVNFLLENGKGGFPASASLQDWLISRQVRESANDNLMPFSFSLKNKPVF